VSHITGADIKIANNKNMGEASFERHLSFLFIALALWLYVNLYNQYTPFVTVPLDILI
jgi:hypothetical protein